MNVYNITQITISQRPAPPHCFLLSNFKLTVLFHFLFATCMYILYTLEMYMYLHQWLVFLYLHGQTTYIACVLYEINIICKYSSVTISIQNGNIGIWFINFCIQYCWCAGAPTSLTVPQWRNMSHSNPYMFKYWYCLQLV